MDRETCDRLYAQARRLTARPADVDDLVQETLLAALQAGRSDLPWLSGVLRNQAALQARSAVRRRRRESFEAAAQEGAVEEAASEAVDRGLVPRIPDWLRRLPPASRKVAVLALHGLSAEEIRWLLGISPVAFRQRLTGIRKALAGLRPAERSESLALAYVRDPARSADLQFGLVRRALKAAMFGSDGLGTHDGDGHLLVIRTRAHTSGAGGNR